MFIPPQPIPATKIHAPCIAEWENIWQCTPELLKQIEDEADSSKTVYFKKAGVHYNKNQIGIDSQRTNSHMDLSAAGTQNEFFRNMHNNFYLTVLAATEWYRQEYSIRESMQHTEEYNLLRYQTGEEYGAHYDGGSALGRSTSPILYLNDDYKGGELEFVNFGIKVKPKAGSLFIFPATFPYAHIAHPVKDGTKYAIVTWLHDVIL
jgi:hypothetical protein